MNDINVKVDYEYTSNPFTAIRWLNSLGPTAAFDFETASKYSTADKTRYELELETSNDRARKRILRQRISSTGLSHPSLSRLTHISFADCDNFARIIILDKPLITRRVLHWLTTTNRLQVWHNATFDFKFIYYYTGKFPRYYEDSQQLAKSVINHVNVWKANTQLKLLMGHKYGAWAVTADKFVQDNLFDEDLIKYAGYDAAATYSLWNAQQQYLKETNAVQDTINS